MYRFLVLTAGALAAIASIGAWGNPGGGGVALSVTTGSPVVLSGEKQTAYLRVALTGEAGEERGRAPVNLALVLDRSGSMQGSKIERAKEAAIHAISRLHSDDIVAVVAYDTTVDVIVPATKVSERESIYQAIRRLQPGATTALFAGVSKGAQEVRKFMGRINVKAGTPGGDVAYTTSPYVNRIILLSDGLANEGPCSPGALADLGVSLGREGITVTTLGLGEDYNEDLMTALALKSDGNHMFIRSETDMQAAFDRELGDVLSVVAKEVQVRITFPEGVRPVRLLGRDAAIAGQVVTTYINNVYGGQMKYVLVEAELPALTVMPMFQMATVDMSYSDAHNTFNRSEGKALIEVTDRPERVRVDKDVMVSVAQQIGAENNRIAMELRDQGKTEESRRLLNQNVDYLEKQADDYDSSVLRIDADTNNSIVIRWEDGDQWNFLRKEMREYQHNTANQQSNYISKDKTPVQE